MKNNILFLLIAFIACSCGQNDNDSRPPQTAELSTVSRSEDLSRPKESNISKDSNLSKKIIKNGRMEISVEEIEPSKTFVDSAINRYGGYLANEHYENEEKYRRYRLTIRIPAERFEAFLAYLERGPGEITSKSIGSRDVTEEYIDLEARLENKRKYLGRYHELLNRANTVEEILQIEEKIRNLEEEIESVTGRLEYLDNQVAYSTLHLTLEEEKPFTFTGVKDLDFTERLKKSLGQGWTLFVRFILGIIYLWPFVAAGLIIWIVLWRKHRKKKAGRN